MAAGPARGYELVACCVDGPDGGAALEEAVRVAALAEARLSVVHVAETAGRFTGGRTAWSPPEEEVAAEIVKQARAWLGPLGDGAGGAGGVVLQGAGPARERLG